jgi:hypothetical protein
MIDGPSWLDDFPPAQRAALAIHLEEIGRRGFSLLPHGEVARRAGCGRSAVVCAVATACARRHIVVERRQGDQNVVRLPTETRGYGGRKSTGWEGP